jgi:dTDP-4-dehydrorhamnose reductase
MWPLVRDGIVVCEIENQDAVEQLWKKHQLHNLLNCAGGCRLKSCEYDPAMTHRFNVLGAEYMLGRTTGLRLGLSSNSQLHC